MADDQVVDPHIHPAGTRAAEDGERPQNARFIRDDGHEFPLDLVYEGQRGGKHLWTVRSHAHPGFGKWRLCVDNVTPGSDIRAELRRVSPGCWVWVANQGGPVSVGGPYRPASGPVSPASEPDRDA